MQQVKLVSVVIPVFNGSKYIRAALESVINQTYRNLEILVVDDGSSDDTAEVVKLIQDTRIFYIARQHSGLQKTLNFGISRATGEYIARLDADDLWESDHVQDAVEILERDFNLSVSYSDFLTIDGDGNSIERWDPNYSCHSFAEACRKLPYSNCLVAGSMVIRTKILQDLGFATWAVAMEDYHLSIRLLASGHVFNFTNKPTYIYRKHGAAITASALYENLGFRFAAIKLSGCSAALRVGRWGAIQTNLLIAAMLDFLRGCRSLLRNKYKNYRDI